MHPLVAGSPSSPVDDFTPMQHMILYLKGDTTQEAALAQLVAQQHDPKSPLYHQFLSPQNFASQFGVAKADMDKVTAWLESHGFKVEQQVAGQRAIIFSGTSGQVSEAFKTEIRQYKTAGSTHYANSSDPQIPAALADVVGGVVKLHNFQHSANISKFASVSNAQLANPNFTYGSSHYLSPADYATIYDISPLYSASINGAGQSVAVLARSNIYLSDIESFRSMFGLQANDPQIVITNSDPGIVDGDTVETTLDTEWSGAVASGANVKVIVSASTYTADGIDLSALYAVNNNVAPIVSLSYGSCEADMGSSELAFYNSLWQQAAAQGMTVLVSSGDSGAAGCQGGSSTAGSGRGVNGLCSSPYATCVGGTEFAEGNNPGQYWLPGNNAVYGSAVSYIPEAVWNESGSDGGSGLWAGGGGASIAYTKPSWQAGPGVPADGHRDVPDVSLSAAGHDGYLIALDGGLDSVGGTSAAAPSFAGLMALVDQKMNARQGLANATLYPLAATQAAGGPAVFHDITAGNNSVPGVTGYNAAAGYDPASGLGSVDAAQLVNHWSGAIAPTISLTASSSTLTVKTGQTVQTTITSKASSTLKSAVTLTVSGAPSGVTATFANKTIASPGSGSASLNVSASATAKPGSYTLTVTAQGGGQTASLALSIVIPTPSFSISASSTSLNVIAGNSGKISVTSTLQNGVVPSIALSASGVPSGVTATFSPASLSGTSNAVSSLTLAVSKTATPGTYALTVSAVSNGVTESVSLSLTVLTPPSCTLATNPANVTLTSGQSTSFAASCTAPQGGLSGSLTLSTSGLPADVTIQRPSTLAVGSSGTLTLTSTLAAPGGSYHISLSVSGGGFTQTLSIPLTVTAPSIFTLTPTQGAVSVKAGGSGSMTLSSTRYGSFNSAVSLSVSGLPTGVTATFSKSAVPAPGSGTSVVTFAAASTAKAGSYKIVVTGTGSGQSQIVPVTLTITAK
jgi:subtilase family serine protease